VRLWPHISPCTLPEHAELLGQRYNFSFICCADKRDSLTRLTLLYCATVAASQSIDVDPTSRHAGAASRHSRKLPSTAAASTATSSSSSSSKAHTSHLSAPAAPLHLAPPAPPAAGTASAAATAGSGSGHSSAASLLLHPHRAVARLSSALHNHTNRYCTLHYCMIHIAQGKQFVTCHA
jgi:hypothetical protein